MKTIYTYGYTGGSLADLKRYAEAGALVVDTRFAPASRNPIWRKAYLQRELGAAYEWWGSTLGNRNYRGGPISIVDLPQGLEALSLVFHLRPVVLLCACSLPDGCHRRVIAEALQDYARNVDITHLCRGAVL